MPRKKDNSKAKDELTKIVANYKDIAIIIKNDVENLSKVNYIGLITIIKISKELRKNLNKFITKLENELQERIIKENDKQKTRIKIKKL